MTVTSPPNHGANLGQVARDAATALSRVLSYWEDNDLPPDFSTPETGYPFALSLEDQIAEVHAWADHLDGCGAKVASVQLVERSVSIEGVTTEAMWRDLEDALGLARYGLGRFKEWAADEPKHFGSSQYSQYNLDAAVAWARQHGLTYEEERRVRISGGAHETGGAGN